MVTTARRQGINANIAIKAPCKVATTANITLSGEQTIDGVAVVADDRVLVKSQTDDTENGIYDVSTGSWSRSPDFDGSYDVSQGTLIPVNQGTVGANTYYDVSTTGAITVGTSSINFTQVLSSQGFAGVLLHRNGTTQSTSSGTGTQIEWTTETYDTDGAHSTSSNTQLVTVPTGYSKAKYDYQVAFTAAGTGYRDAQLRLNIDVTDPGQSYQITTSPSTAYKTYLRGSGVLPVSAGDTIDIDVTQTSGSDLTISGNAYDTWLSVEFII